jgi:hypothetical protein
MLNRKYLNPEQPELDANLREPLDEEERILMDPDSWDWENIQEGTPSPDRYSISEVELSHDESALIERAARAQGMTVIEYLRHAALERAFQFAAAERERAVR